MISQLSSHHSDRPPSSASSAVGLANVLIVDDQPANVLALEAVLEPLRQRVNAVDSDPGALEVIEELYP